MINKKYEEKIISQMKCADFLKFKFNNKIFYIEDINMPKNELMNFISQCTIIYKDKEFSFEEYNSDLKLTSKKISADLIDDSYIRNCDEIFMKHKKYYRVLKFFESIGFNISCAKYYADLSYQKLPDSVFDTINNYAKVYLIRGMHFLTSVMWYSTCRDYLVQIFCAKFDLYSKITKKDISKMKFDELVRLCRFEKIIELQEEYKNDTEFTLWFEKLNECVNFLNSKLIPLNNNLKHNGGCNLKYFNGIYYIRDNNETNIEYFNIPNIDIDKKYDLLIQSHNSIVECYDFFLDRFNSELDLIIKRNTIK